MKIKITEKSVGGIRPQEKAKEYRDSDLKGFFVRMEPSGQGAYYYEHCFPNGARKKTKLGSIGMFKASDARAVAMKLKVELAAEARDHGITRFEKITLGEFLTRDYDNYVKNNVKMGLDFTNRIRKSFPEFLNLRLDQITPYQFDLWRSKFVHGRKPGTVNVVTAYLKAALNKAVEWKIIAINPIRDCKLLRIDKKPITRFLYPDELERLARALSERERELRVKRASGNQWRRVRKYELMDSLEVGFADHMAPMIFLSLNTGMRQGEVFNLRWGDVNFRENLVVVQGTHAKSSQTRQIPMADMTRKTLELWRKQSTPESEEGLVFPSPVTGKRFHDVKKAWSEVLTKAGITKFRWHDMRHHFASALAQKGVSLQVIKDLLGHSSIEMTLRYADLDRTTLAHAVSQLSIGHDFELPQETV